MIEWLRDASPFLTIILTALAMLGGAYSFWTQRLHRRAIERLTNAQADGETIENITELLVALGSARKQRLQDFDEIINLKRQMIALQEEMAALKKEYEEKFHTMERIIFLAIGYIDRLHIQMKNTGETPEPIPQELERWQTIHGRTRE